MKKQYRTEAAKPVELAMFGSMTELSVQAGIPIDILKEAKRGGCKFVRHGRADLMEFIRWYFSTNLTNEESESWTRRDKRAGALLKEQKLEEARKRVIDFEFVMQFTADMLKNCYWGELERLAQELPPTLKGKDEVQIHEEVLRHVVRIKKATRERLEAWQKANQDES